MKNKLLRGLLPPFLAILIILTGMTLPSAVLKSRMEKIDDLSLSIDIADMPIYSGTSAKNNTQLDRLSAVSAIVNVDIYGEETYDVTLIRRSPTKDELSAENAARFASLIMAQLLEQMSIIDPKGDSKSDSINADLIFQSAEATLICDSDEPSIAFWKINFDEDCKVVLDARTGLLLYIAFSAEMTAATVQSSDLPATLYDNAVEIYRDVFDFPTTPSRSVVSNLFFGCYGITGDEKYTLQTAVELSPGQGLWYKSEVYREYGAFDVTDSYIFDFTIRILA